MGSKLYVGGLPYSATEQQLTETFGAHGTVASAKIISDKFTGQSRGFGFVTFECVSDCEDAISSMNGKVCMSKKLIFHAQMCNFICNLIYVILPKTKSI